MEHVKIFSRIEIIDPFRHGNENGFEYEAKMKKLGKEIPLVEKDYEEWLRANPNVEIIKKELQTHLAVAEASTSFMYAMTGWMCHVANLMVTYQEKQSS